MQESVNNRRRFPVLHISLRTRILGMFTVLYTLGYFGMFTFIRNLASRTVTEALATTDLPNVSGETATRIADSVLTQVRNVAIPGFIISFAFLIVVVFIASYGITRPLRALTRYAERVSAGDYTSTKIPNIDFLHDEITTLSQVFEMMVSKIREREQTLTARVKELEITIDEARKAKQVEEIVDSEFFTNLKDQVRDLKARKKPEHSTEAGSDTIPKVSE